jgi:hypothetical protein
MTGTSNYAIKKSVCKTTVVVMWAIESSGAVVVIWAV